jgi:hypothetical protein
MTYKRPDKAFKLKLAKRADELRMQRMTEKLAVILTKLRRVK